MLCAAASSAVYRLLLNIVTAARILTSACRHQVPAAWKQRSIGCQPLCPPCLSLTALDSVLELTGLTAALSYVIVEPRGVLKTPKFKRGTLGLRPSDG